MTNGFVGFGGNAPLHFREFIDYLYKKYSGGIPTKPTKPDPSPISVHDFDESCHAPPP